MSEPPVSHRSLGPALKGFFCRVTAPYQTTGPGPVCRLQPHSLSLQSFGEPRKQEGTGGYKVGSGAGGRAGVGKIRKRWTIQRARAHESCFHRPTGEQTPPRWPVTLPTSNLGTVIHRLPRPLLCARRLQGDMDIIGTEGNQVLGRYNFSGASETLQSVRERE